MLDGQFYLDGVVGLPNMLDGPLNPSASSQPDAQSRTSGLQGTNGHAKPARDLVPPDSLCDPVLNSLDIFWRELPCRRHAVLFSRKGSQRGQYSMPQRPFGFKICAPTLLMELSRSVHIRKSTGVRKWGSGKN